MVLPLSKYGFRECCRPTKGDGGHRAQGGCRLGGWVGVHRVGAGVLARGGVPRGVAFAWLGFCSSVEHTDSGKRTLQIES